MKIIYIANACEHVVRPFCDGLFREFGDDFKFLEVIGLDPSRAGIGSLQEREYVLNLTGDRQKAKQLCNEADIVIFAGVDLYFIEDRIKQNKPTIYYSERLFKKGIISLFKPKNFFHIRNYLVNPSKNSNFYLLAASAYAADDFYRINAFKDRIFKWGYQVQVYEKDIEKLICQKQVDGLQLIWVGRLVKLKHCDHAIMVVSRLKKQGYNPKLTIIGYGQEEDNLKALVRKLQLEDNVVFKGKCSIEDTRLEMDKANIFMFTSDKREGWGATLNEAMNSACACVASTSAGSTGFLVEDGEDGLVYSNENIDTLYENVKYLIDNREKREAISRKAYDKMINVWNPNKSYTRLIKLFEAVLNGTATDLYEDGPCSKALPQKRK